MVRPRPWGQGTESPRVPACGSPLDPVGDVHPGTRPTSLRAPRTNAGSLRMTIARRAADRQSHSNVTAPRFTRRGKTYCPAAAHRVPAGREGPLDTAHGQREAPTTALAVIGASHFLQVLRLFRLSCRLCRLRRLWSDAHTVASAVLCRIAARAGRRSDSACTGPPAAPAPQVPA